MKKKDIEVPKFLIQCQDKKKCCSFRFASLYPSLIMQETCVYSTFVDNDDIPDEMCHVMEWDDHVACSHDPKVIRKMLLQRS